MMNLFGVVQYGVFIAVVVLLVKPLGRYMARVFAREHTGFDRLLVPIERRLYRLYGVDPDRKMN